MEPRLERVARDDEGRLRVHRVDIDRDLPGAQRCGIMGILTILLPKAGQGVECLDGLVLRAAFDRAVVR